MTDNMMELLKEQYFQDMFGKQPSEMNQEELLEATAIVSNRLYETTGRSIYKDLETVVCQMLAERRAKKGGDLKGETFGRH